MFWLKSPNFGIILRFAPKFNQAEFRIFRYFSIFAFILFFLNCSAPPVNLKCQELRARLDRQSLSEDEKHFAEQELRACEQELESAKLRDSASMEKLHQRFSPQDSL